MFASFFLSFWVDSRLPRLAYPEEHRTRVTRWICAASWPTHRQRVAFYNQAEPSTPRLAPLTPEKPDLCRDSVCGRLRKRAVFCEFAHVTYDLTESLTGSSRPILVSTPKGAPFGRYRAHAMASALLRNGNPSKAPPVTASSELSPLLHGDGDASVGHEAVADQSARIVKHFS